ncbi:hypothetical protein G6F24_017168 [Rhizopus arrhizus]|nr:hypothetical protein G6F24_017168 [Rhizopus arrhizus]
MAAAHVGVGVGVRLVGMAGGDVGKRAAGLGQGAHGAQHAAHIGVLDAGHGLARGPVHRTALHAVRGIGERMLRAAFIMMNMASSPRFS